MKKMFYVAIVVLIAVFGLMNIRPDYDKYKHLPWGMLEESLVKSSLPYEMRYSSNEYFKEGEVIEIHVVNGTWRVTVCNGAEALKPTTWEPDPYVEFKTPIAQVIQVEPSTPKQ